MSASTPLGIEPDAVEGLGRVLDPLLRSKPKKKQPVLEETPEKIANYPGCGMAHIKPKKPTPPKKTSKPTPVIRRNKQAATDISGHIIKHGPLVGSLLGAAAGALGGHALSPEGKSPWPATVGAGIMGASAGYLGGDLLKDEVIKYKGRQADKYFASLQPATTAYLQLHPKEQKRVALLHMFRPDLAANDPVYQQVKPLLEHELGVIPPETHAHAKEMVLLDTPGRSVMTQLGKQASSSQGITTSNGGQATSDDARQRQDMMDVMEPYPNRKLQQSRLNAKRDEKIWARTQNDMAKVAAEPTPTPVPTPAKYTPKIPQISMTPAVRVPAQPNYRETVSAPFVGPVRIPGYSTALVQPKTPVYPPAEPHKPSLDAGDLYVSQPNYVEGRPYQSGPSAIWHRGMSLPKHAVRRPAFDDYNPVPRPSVGVRGLRMPKKLPTITPEIWQNAKQSSATMTKLADGLVPNSNTMTNDWWSNLKWRFGIGNQPGYTNAQEMQKTFKGGVTVPFDKGPPPIKRLPPKPGATPRPAPTPMGAVKPPMGAAKPPMQVKPAAFAAIGKSQPPAPKGAPPGWKPLQGNRGTQIMPGYNPNILKDNGPVDQPPRGQPGIPKQQVPLVQPLFPGAGFNPAVKKSAVETVPLQKVMDEAKKQKKRKPLGNLNPVETALKAAGLYPQYPGAKKEASRGAAGNSAFGIYNRWTGPDTARVPMGRSGFDWSDNRHGTCGVAGNPVHAKSQLDGAKTAGTQTQGRNSILGDARILQVLFGRADAAIKVADVLPNPQAPSLSLSPQARPLPPVPVVPQSPAAQTPGKPLGMPPAPAGLDTLKMTNSAKPALGTAQSGNPAVTAGNTGDQPAPGGV